MLYFCVDWGWNWDAIGAAGTWAAVAFALFYPMLEKIRAQPNISLTLFQEQGMFVESGGAWTLNFHLLLTNRGGVARKASVFCNEIGVAGENGAVKRVQIPRVRLRWPYEKDPQARVDATRDIVDSELVDLCVLRTNHENVTLTLANLPDTVSHHLRNHGQGERYIILFVFLVSDNFVSKPRGFKVVWSGNATNERAQLTNHLRVESYS